MNNAGGGSLKYLPCIFDVIHLLEWSEKMKRIIQIIIFVIIVSIGVAVYAGYTEPIPDNRYNLPYMIILYNDEGKHAHENYRLIYSSVPLVVTELDFYGDETGYMGLRGMVGDEEKFTVHYYIYEKSTGWYEMYYRTSEDRRTVWTCMEIVYTNYSVGLATTTFELEENQSSFFGIDFDYSCFWGDLKLQIGKKEESGTYKILKEWQYPKGSGHVSIPAGEIPQGNKGEYVIIIYEGDTIIQQFPYTMNVEEGPYCEINYPVNGMSYEYFPNVNIRYKDMGRLYIYINGKIYKVIYTKDIEGIEVIDGNDKRFDIGMNTVTVEDSNYKVVATVQFEVLREGPDLGGGIPEYEAESWVKELFNKIMNEYSLFFEYVRGIYGFLPVEIVGLVVIIMMLAVILWFTGRK